MVIVWFFVALTLVGIGVWEYGAQIWYARRWKEEIDWYGSLIIADVFIIVGLFIFVLVLSQLHLT